MHKSDFYRQRARAAEEIAKHWRDETAKQMIRKAADRWRELAKLARQRGKSRPATPNKA